MKAISYISPKAAVLPSSVHGRGLFAVEAIRAGEIVCAKGGHIFTREQQRTVAPLLGSAEIQIAEDLFIGPLEPEEREASMIFSNHSCNPNIGVQGQIVFVAMRDIEAGEELTHDWATSDDDDYEMECRCNTPNCRKRITGQDWRRKELQEKYRGFISWYLQEKIAREPHSQRDSGYRGNQTVGKVRDTSRMIVRRATMLDLDLVAPLFDAYRQFYRKPANLAVAKQFLSERLKHNESVIFVATGESGAALGFVQLFPSFSSGSAARILILNDLFVVPDGRRTGVGTSLIRAAADFGKSIGAVRLTLSTEVTNKSAQALYEAEGWKLQTDFCVYNLALA